MISTESDHVLLERDGLRITVVAIPAAIARTIAIDDPPARREDTALKLSFPVADIAAARVVAAEHGGVIDPPEREWLFRGERMCDGHDPEGNVIQVCAPASAQGVRYEIVRSRPALAARGEHTRTGG